MVNEKELQEKVLAYRILEARIDGLLKQRELLLNKLLEIETTLMGMEEIEKHENELLFSLGSEVHFFGKVVNKEKVVVELGAGVAVEKNFEDGRRVLNERMEEIEKAIAGLEKEIVEISSGLQSIESQIRELVEKTKEAG